MDNIAADFEIIESSSSAIDDTDLTLLSDIDSIIGLGGKSAAAGSTSGVTLADYQQKCIALEAELVDLKSINVALREQNAHALSIVEHLKDEVNKLTVNAAAPPAASAAVNDAAAQTDDGAYIDYERKIAALEAQVTNLNRRVQEKTDRIECLKGEQFFGTYRVLKNAQNEMAELREQHAEELAELREQCNREKGRLGNRFGAYRKEKELEIEQYQDELNELHASMDDKNKKLGRLGHTIGDLRQEREHLIADYEQRVYDMKTQHNQERGRLGNIIGDLRKQNHAGSYDSPDDYSDDYNDDYYY